MPSEIDYYAILGIDERAGEAEIRAAYRRAARSNHPDHNPYDPLAARKFAIVQEAYDVLGDPGQRAAYRRPGRRTVFEAAPASRPTSPANGRVGSSSPATDLSPEVREVIRTVRGLVRRARLHKRFRQVIRYLERL